MTRCRDPSQVRPMRRMSKCKTWRCCKASQLDFRKTDRPKLSRNQLKTSSIRGSPMFWRGRGRSIARRATQSTFLTASCNRELAQDGRQTCHEICTSQRCVHGAWPRQYVKENLAEMNGKWETFNEAKEQKMLLQAVHLDYLMHHCDAQACEKNTTWCCRRSQNGVVRWQLRWCHPSTYLGGLGFWQCVALTALEVLRL